MAQELVPSQGDLAFTNLFHDPFVEEDYDVVITAGCGIVAMNSSAYNPVSTRMFHVYYGSPATGTQLVPMRHIQFAASTQYTVTMKILRSSATSPNVNLLYRPSVSATSSTGSVTIATGIQQPSQGVWTSVKYTFTTSSTAAAVGQAGLTFSMASAVNLRVRDILVVQGNLTTPPTVFDGESGLTAAGFHDWAGTAYSSESREYAIEWVPARRLEVLSIPSSGTFIVGRNVVGDPISLDGTDPTWIEVGCDARSINVVRGGTRSGVSTTLDVGMLYATLVNEWDPADTPTVKPNTPVRLTNTTRIPGSKLWDWNTADSVEPWLNAVVTTSTHGQTMTHEADPWATGNALVVELLNPTDDIAWGAIKSSPFSLPSGTGTVSVNLKVFAPNDLVNGYGSVSFYMRRSDTGQEFNRVQVAHSFLGDNIPSDWFTMSIDYESAGTVPVEIVLEPHSYSVAVRQVELVSTSYTYEDATLYTGLIQNVSTTYDREGNTFVSLDASDSVQALNNTTRSGAVSDNAVGYETWAARINRLSSSATSSVNPPGITDTQTREVYSYNAFRTYPTTDVGRQDGWAPFGGIGGTGVVQGPFTSASQGNYSMLWERNSTAATSYAVTANTAGLQRTITGLTVGNKYRAEAVVYTTSTGYYTNWAIGVTGKGFGDPVLQLEDEAVPMSYEFVATATSHQVRIVISESGSYPAPGAGYPIASAYFAGVKLSEIVSDAVVLQDTALEASLAAHFDMTSNSIGAIWWVDEDNVAQFRIGLTEADEYVARFSDVHEEQTQAGESPHVCYTSVQVGYATANVVNDIVFNNHGRDAGTGAAVNTTSTETDAASIAAWGSRADTLDVSIYDTGVFTGSIAKVAQMIFAATAEPELVATSVTFNADDFPYIQLDLDVFSRVLVTHRGNNYSCRVIQMEHNMSAGGSWMTTLTLAKEYLNG